MRKRLRRFVLHYWVARQYTGRLRAAWIAFQFARLPLPVLEVDDFAPLPGDPTPMSLHGLSSWEQAPLGQPVGGRPVGGWSDCGPDGVGAGQKSAAEGV